MKHCGAKSLQLLACTCLFLAATSARAGFFYWDANGSTPGAGGPAPTGTWGTDAYFTSDSTGSSATTTWSGGNVSFSAGTDATGTFTVDVTGIQSVSDIHFEEGTVTLQSVSGGSLNLNVDPFLGNSRFISAAPGVTAFVNVPLSSNPGVTNFTKYNSGTVVLGATNTYTAPTRIEGGTLRLGAPHVMPDSSGLTFAVAQQEGITDTPAIFHTGGFSEIMGTLTLQTNGTIDFGDGNSALSFADSSAIDWGGFNLVITNFTLGVDSLRFGTSSSGLTPTQLSEIRFADYGDLPGQIDFNGFVTPVPEPSVIALVSLTLAGIGIRIRRKIA